MKKFAPIAAYLLLCAFAFYLPVNVYIKTQNLHKNGISLIFEEGIHKFQESNYSYYNALIDIHIPYSIKSGSYLNAYLRKKYETNLQKKSPGKYLYINKENQPLMRVYFKKGKDSYAVASTSAEDAADKNLYLDLYPETYNPKKKTLDFRTPLAKKLLYTEDEDNIIKGRIIEKYKSKQITAASQKDSEEDYIEYVMSKEIKIYDGCFEVVEYYADGVPFKTLLKEGKTSKEKKSLNKDAKDLSVR